MGPTATRSPPVPPATTCSLSATNACLQHLRPLQQAQGHQRFPYLYGRFQLKGQQRFPHLRPSPPKSSSAISTPREPHHPHHDHHDSRECPHEDYQDHQHVHHVRPKTKPTAATPLCKYHHRPPVPLLLHYFTGPVPQ